MVMNKAQISWLGRIAAVASAIAVMFGLVTTVWSKLGLPSPFLLSSAYAIDQDELDSRLTSMEAGISENREELKAINRNQLLSQELQLLSWIQQLKTEMKLVGEDNQTLASTLNTQLYQAEQTLRSVRMQLERDF